MKTFITRRHLSKHNDFGSIYKLHARTHIKICIGRSWKWDVIEEFAMEQKGKKWTIYVSAINNSMLFRDKYPSVVYEVCKQPSWKCAFCLKVSKLCRYISQKLFKIITLNTGAPWSRFSTFYHLHIWIAKLQNCFLSIFPLF